MIKNFFKKLLEIWLQGLYINGRNEVDRQESMMLVIRSFNQKDRSL